MLILHGLDACEQVSPQLGQALRGIIELLGPVPTIEGTYRLGVTQATCVNLDDCTVIEDEELGVAFVVSGCNGGTCSIRNIEGVWQNVSALTFDGANWRASGTETLDFGFYCNGVGRPTGFDLQFQVDSADAVTGTYFASSTTNLAECRSVQESFSLSGSRG